MATSSWLRVAVVQFAPKIGEVHANIVKARELCRGLTPRSVDLVCFPEMIFSGYMFPDAPSIAPYLEHPRTGPTSTFCAELARHLECHVVAGLPERLESEPSAQSPVLSHTAPGATTTTASVPDPSVPPLVGANAANIYGPTGRILHTYHKSNLFPVDRTWARPGPGFTALDLPAPFGRTAVAICFDLNVRVRIMPGGWEEGGVWTSLEDGPYELAEYCRREGVRVLVLLNAWLKSKEEEEEEEEEEEQWEDRDRGDGGSGRDEVTVVDGEEDGDGMKPDWEVLNYWAMRLRPLWAKREDDHANTESMNADTDGRRQPETGTSPETAQARMMDDDVLVVVSNRFGHERGKTFAGSSAMFSMRPGSGKPRLLHAMGQREEGACVWSARRSGYRALG